MIKEIPDEQRLTLLKHLASGKDIDTVATILGMKPGEVLGIANHHGYPSVEKLEKAADLVAAKIDRAHAIPERQGRPLVGQVETFERPTATARPVAVSVTPGATGPTLSTTSEVDETRTLINTGKNHPSKRIQAAADRVVDAVAKLRDLLADDEAKHAARRTEEAAKAEARAEIQRLEKKLAAAKAKLRGPKPTATTIDVPGSVSSADLRAWARTKGIDVPPVGRVPAAVREQYAAEHQDGAA